MNDFLNGWSQGMTGSSSGNPSQSVLEAMGRQAARDQWNNNSAQQYSGGGYQVARNSTPVTTLLYQAGQKMTLKKLGRDLAIGAALILTGIMLMVIFGRSAEWIAAVPTIPGYLMVLWVFLRAPFYMIARIGGLFSAKPETTEKVETTQKE